MFSLPLKELIFLCFMHNYYCSLVKLQSDRLLHKLYQTDKQLFLNGSKSWLTNIRHMVKLLNIQELEIYNKDGLIKILKASYKNKVKNNLTHVKESSDSKLELFSTRYDNSNMPCYLNMIFVKLRVL